MTTPTWPATLPQSPEMQSFARTFQAIGVRSSISGQAYQTPRHEEALASLDLSWIMTGAQLQDFSDFIENQAASGAAFFFITLPIVSPAFTYLARFAAGPSWEYIAPDIWRVHTQLEFIDPAPVSPDILASIDALGGQAEFDAITAAFATYPGFATFFAQWEIDFGQF